MAGIELDGVNQKVVLDSDGDTYLEAATDDTVKVYVAGAQDFTITANTLTAESGSTIAAQALTATTITASGILKTDDATEATSTTDGSLQTDGGLSVVKDTVLGDDLKLLSDSSVVAFGADGDTTLTHTDGTGLTLNSTNKLCFNDASQFIQGSSGTVLSIGATDEIDLTATAVDLNGTLNVSGVATFQATPVFPDGSLALADLDIDGGTDIGAAIADADLFIIDDGAGGTNRKTAASRLKTYIGGGITHASQWRTTTNVTGDNEPLVNMETNDTAGYGLIGDNMTESSGVFTFPTTGYWLVKITGGFFYDGDSAYNNISINYTANNGTNWALKSYSSGMCQTTSSAAGFANANAAFLFDITDTGNQKVRFGGDVQNNGTTTMGGSNYHTGTHITFMRLGDTQNG